ncbi:MAG: hypothetical protein GXP31_14905 [Kiritimatiellaeota bacterium]|nr:hypothetical protein [Kiritimatiellota bacterium]
MLTIDTPFHGAVLNSRHGRETPTGLAVTVRGRAPMDAAVSVNGINARRAGEFFEAEVVIEAANSEICARTEGGRGRREHRIRVYRDRGSFPRYRFGIDDNSFFLRDICRKRPNSLFDCFYLDILRGFHREYGTKFVLNIFYSTPEKDFALDQFPTRYRGEWRDNVDWLKLSFHAWNEFPDRPYQYASALKLADDFDRVQEEIVRFAGESTWSPPTILHWGMAPQAVWPVLVDRGVRVLSGYFRRAEESGRYDVNYLVDAERSEYLWRHDALMDFDAGLTFSRVDLVCNTKPVEQIVPLLERLAQDPNTAEIMDLMTHEQYFWPFYKNHIPDHANRLDAALRWVTEQGYRPVFFHEGFLGNTGSLAT